MIDKRAPFPGDVLLDPPRQVSWVDRNTREYRCQPLHGTPAENYGADNLPKLMRDAPWEQAPIEDGWRDVTKEPT